MQKPLAVYSALVSLDGEGKVLGREYLTRDLAKPLGSNFTVGFGALGYITVTKSHYVTVVGKGEVKLTHVVSEHFGIRDV